MAIVTALAIETDMAIMTALIMTVLAIETDMVIVTVLAIKTDIHGYRDRPGHQNRHGYRDRTGLETDMAFVTALVIETDMAIVTALVIETDMAIVTVLASKPTFIFPELNRVSNTRNAFQGSKELQSSKWRSSRRPSWLGTLCRVVTLLVTVETSDMTQVLASRAGNVGGIDIGGWGRTRVVLSPLVFQATLSLLLLPSFLVRGLAILRTREMWVREVWGLVLSLFGGGGSLILGFPSR